MKKMTKLILLIITLSWEFQTINGLAQGTWNQKSNCIVGGDALANFSIGNNGYMLQYPNAFWEWNKSSNTWSRKSDFPGTPRGGTAGFSIGTKGYICGGQLYGGFYTDLWEWDQSTDTWTPKANKGGVGSESASGFSIGNKGYIVGGYTGLSNSIPELWEWDQTTNSWSQKATCPSGEKYGAVAFSIGTKGYFGTGGPGAATKDFWEWDQSTDTWSQKADFGGGERYGAIRFSIGTKGYIDTGMDNLGTYYQDLWEWNQTNDTWTPKSDFPGMARSGAIGFAINGKGYIGAGTSIDTATSLTISQKDFWEFDPNYAPPPNPATIAIAAGGSHSLFLCNNNTSMSCGYNYYGQLGDETAINKSTPVNVGSLNGITAISGGGGHSLFLKNDGLVWALGMNYYGQLGDGAHVDKSIPVQVSSLIGITAISAGDSHSLFLKNNGTVWACGFNDFLQLGDGSSTDKTIPIQLSSLSGITAISAGYQHSLFLKNDGTVWACGNNTSGALGDGTNIDKSIPVQVTSITNITAVAAGTSFSLFLKNDGTVWACGNNGFGQLGQGTDHTSTPIQVSSLSDIISISAQDNHSLFLKNDGSVWACGSNNYGQLGDGTTVDKLTPVLVSSLSGITSIAAGGRFSLFLKNDGTAWACGNNTYGELGDGTTVHKSIPVQVIGLCLTCAPPQAPTAANATLCANNTANLSAIGTATLGWYNLAIGGIYLGGGANYITPILNTTTTYYVQDSTCAASATRKAVVVTVNPLPTIMANASATHICAGASVTLTGVGGSSYTWSGGVTDGNGFIPATTTTYTVTGTDGNNCSNTTTKTIHVNPLPEVTANASATMVCEGTSVTLTGGGASSYTWSGGVTNGIGFIPSTTTTYIVTGTDGNNCSNTATKTIHVNPLPIVTANASATTVCEGTSVTLTGGGASSYVWTEGVNDGLAFVTSSTTTYTVTGTDANNCSNTATKTINVTPLLDLTTSLSGLTISANQTGANYQWLDCNNGNSVIAVATSQSYTASINGNYAVIVKMNSCSDTSTCVNVSITGIEKITENNIQLKVFPNPGNGSITITLSPSASLRTGSVEGQSINEGIYTIKNESGQTIQTFKLNTSNNYTINIENLSNGIYFIVGLNGNQMINQKVVVAK